MRSSFWLAVPLVLGAAPAGAQDAAPAAGCTVDCPDLVVFGRDLDPAPRDPITARISRTTDGTERVEAVLRSVPGLQQFRRSDARSANPTSQGITLRGLGGNASSRALVTLDGVPQADPFGGWIAWPGYDAAAISDVEVRPGVGMVSAGPGALAGTVSLLSATGGDASNRLWFSGGSRASVEARGRGQWRLGGAVVQLSGSYDRGDGFVPIIARQRGPIDRAARYESGGVALRLLAPVAGDVEVQANVRGFTDRRTRGVAFSANRNDGLDASVRLVRKGEDGLDWSLLAYGQRRDFASQFGAVSADRRTVTPTLDQYDVPATGWGARAELRPRVGDAGTLRIGADWRRTSGETREDFTYVAGVPTRNRRAGGQTDVFGGFVEGDWTTGPVTLSAGVRADRWEIRDGFRREINIGGTVRSDERFGDRSAWEATARGGAAWRAADGVTLRTAAYTGWRLPTLNELYRPFRVGADATAANEALAPERVRGVEAGVDVVRGGTSLSATLFASRLSDAIANVSLGQGPGLFPGVGFVAAGGTYRQRANLPAIISRGLELTASHRTGPLGVTASYALIDAAVDGRGASAALDGLRPAQVPRHFVTTRIDWQAARWNAGVTGRLVSGQFEDDLNRQRLGAAFTIDADARGPLAGPVQWSVRAENLFDAQVDAAVSASGIVERATPRTLWIGLSLDLR